MTQPIHDLPTLLRELKPLLLEGEFVFCSVSPADEQPVLLKTPKATFWEEEGLSVIIERTEADELGLVYDSVHRCITLQVHSSLMAVGLTAAVSSALAAAGLSANVVAAHHHDHVFVPAESADEAQRILLAMVRVS